MKKWRKFRALIWLALPLLILWAVRQTSFYEIWNTLRELSWLQLGSLMAINGAILLIFSSRWWLILRAQGFRIPYLYLSGYRLAAFAVSYFTPGTQFGGEPLQIHLLCKRHQTPQTTALASVALDKIFELLANFTFLAVGLVLFIDHATFPEGMQVSSLNLGFNGTQTAIGIALLLGLPILYLFILGFGRFPLAQLSQRLPNFLLEWKAFKRLPTLIASTERQISALFRHQPVTILAAILISGFIWVLLMVEFWLTIRFLGVDLNLYQLIIALTAARLAFLTPLPGGLGALEASQVFAMQALGFSPAVGLSASLLIRARDLSLGAIGLWLGAAYTRSQTATPVASEKDGPQPALP